MTAAEPLGVDFGAPTGAVHGGASGMLYGLGDDGIPSAALIAGARPRTVAQKAPAGLQHPTGDALESSAPFFAGGGTEVLVYMQDIYEKWPYEQLGIDDYLAKATIMLETVAARPDAARFSWVPFNEPDWIWYGDWAVDRERFLHDWELLYREIRRVLPAARIVGMNDMAYNPQRIGDFLPWARDNDLLPDVIAWHELKPESLADYRQHFADYRSLEASLGITPLEVNIDEYSNRRDLSNPGQVIQWLAMFEETKVDADMAFWTYAGNLDDHTVGITQANGGWWLLKWYADLGGQTVATTGTAAGVDRMQAIASIDRHRAQATVLVGGTAASIELSLAGVDLGDLLDVTISRTSWSGYEGDAVAPLVVSRVRVAAADPLLVTVPAGDTMSAWQVVVTPAELDVDAARAPSTTRYEAEDAALTDAVVTVQDDDPQKYATSGGKDVTGLVAATSAVSFAVDSAGGPHVLGIYYGTSAVPGRQALYVDGEFHSVLEYSATLTPAYRGRLDVPLELAAGTRAISLRTSGPGGLLVGSDVALDCLDVTPGIPAASWTYPARAARLHGSAHLETGAPDRPARAALATGSATFFVAAAEPGYYYLAVHLVGTRVEVAVDDRVVLAGDATGHAAATALVHLGRGVSAVRVSGDCAVSAVRIARAAEADSATTTVDAAELVLGGSARLLDSGYVDDLGSVALPRRVAAGPVNATVRYGNDAKNTAHEYNTDVISLYATIAEAGGASLRVPFRHTYARDNFCERVIQLDLATAEGAISITGEGLAPSIRSIDLSPLVLSVSFD